MIGNYIANEKKKNERSKKCINGRQKCGVHKFMGYARVIFFLPFQQLEGGKEENIFT